MRDAGYLGVTHSACTAGIGDCLGAGTNVGKVARLLREQHHELRILGALSAFGPLSIDMYLPSLPSLERVFDAEAASIQFTLTVFFAGLALGQLIIGAQCR